MFSAQLSSIVPRIPPVLTFEIEGCLIVSHVWSAVGAHGGLGEGFRDSRGGSGGGGPGESWRCLASLIGVVAGWVGGPGILEGRDLWGPQGPSWGVLGTRVISAARIDCVLGTSWGRLGA